jgi:hypothetical protein
MDVFCDVALHAKASILGPQPGNLHLLGRDFGRVVGAARAAQFPLG